MRDRAPQEATQRMGLMGDEDPLALFGRASSYVIRVKGVLDARWAHWFDGLTLSADDAETTISRPTGDLAELHGLLSIHDLGLALIEVRQVLTDTAERRRSR